MKITILSMLFLLWGSFSYAQVNLLIPRLSTAQRDTIFNPAVGMEIFNLTENCIQVYNNDGWHTMWCYDCTGDIVSGIVSQPDDTTVCTGDNAVFEVVSSGQVSYQWSVRLRPVYPAGTVFCIPGGAEVVDVTTATGRTWMDHE